MAAGQNILELGGYYFEFTSVVPDDFKCPVCRFTVKDPMQIGGFGHRLVEVRADHCMSKQVTTENNQLT